MLLIFNMCLKEIPIMEMYMLGVGILMELYGLNSQMEHTKFMMFQVKWHIMMKMMNYGRFMIQIQALLLIGMNNNISLWE